MKTGVSQGKVMWQLVHWGCTFYHMFLWHMRGILRTKPIWFWVWFGSCWVLASHSASPQTSGLLSSQSLLVWSSRSALSTSTVSGCTSSSSRVTTTGGLLRLPPPPPPDPPTPPPPPCSLSSSSSSSSSSPASVSWLAESVQVDDNEESLCRSSAWVGTWRLISVVKDSTSGPERQEGGSG